MRFYNTSPRSGNDLINRGNCSIGKGNKAATFDVDFPAAISPEISNSSLACKLFLFLMLFSCTLSAQHLSDTLHLKTIEVTGLKLVKEQAGRTTTRIDSVAMLQAMSANLSDLVQQNTPIFIKEYGRGAMATASFRGTAPSHTQVSWNGLLLNSPMLGMVDFSTIPVYFTDDVSLMHGTASLAQGSGALGGMVRLENKTDWKNKLSGRMVSGIGSYGTFNEYGRINLGGAKFQSQTRAYIDQSDNNYPFVNKLVAEIDPVSGNYIYPSQRNRNAGYSNWGLLQEFYLRATERSVMTFRYWEQSNSRSLPHLLTNETSEQANINRQNERAHRPVAEYTHFGNKGTFSTSFGANLTQLSYQQTNKIAGAPDQQVIQSNSSSEAYSYKANYQLPVNENLSLSMGISSDFLRVDSHNVPINGSETGYKRQRQDYSAYLQASKSIRESLAIQLMLRKDIIGQESAPWIPSAGFEFRPSENKMWFLKGSVARNYHQPTLNDLYFVPGGNPRLKPEEGIQSELGSGMEGVLLNHPYKLSLTTYFSAINNWIIWLPTPQGYWEPTNMKRVNTSGLELNGSLEGKTGRFNYHLNCNYSYTRSINRDDPRNWADESIGKQLPYIPRHSANLTANLERGGYYMIWSWMYYSERFTTTSNDKSSPFDTLYPYFMNNLMIGKKLPCGERMFNIEIKLFNLLNEKYRTVLQYPMPPRNFLVLVRYDF